MSTIKLDQGEGATEPCYSQAQLDERVRMAEAAVVERAKRKCIEAAGACSKQHIGCHAMDVTAINDLLPESGTLLEAHDRDTFEIAVEMVNRQHFPVCPYCYPLKLAEWFATWSDRSALCCTAHRPDVERDYAEDHKGDQTGLVWEPLHRRELAALAAETDAERKEGTKG